MCGVFSPASEIWLHLVAKCIAEVEHKCNQAKFISEVEQTCNQAIFISEVEHKCSQANQVISQDFITDSTSQTGHWSRLNTDSTRETGQ